MQLLALRVLRDDRALPLSCYCPLTRIGRQAFDSSNPRKVFPESAARLATATSTFTNQRWRSRQPAL